jgi:hypothetical protein
MAVEATAVVVAVVVVEVVAAIDATVGELRSSDRKAERQEINARETALGIRRVCVA